MKFIDPLDDSQYENIDSDIVRIETQRNLETNCSSQRHVKSSLAFFVLERFKNQIPIIFCAVCLYEDTS